VADASVLARWRHDLKNQLGIVLGFSELLLNELDPAGAHRADIAEIHAAAQRALELLATLPGEAVEHVDHGPREAVSGEDAT
jgi:hypothetical protein